MQNNSEEVFVSGRVCLFGEHQDWSADHLNAPTHAIIVGTKEGLRARIGAHPNKLVVTSCTLEKGMKRAEMEMNPEALSVVAKSGGFFSYVAGVALAVLSSYSGVCGVIIDIYEVDLPIKKGLSSSGAVCVLVARSFNRIYALNMTVEEEMNLAYIGERHTPSMCGRMDQACVYGNQLSLMTFTKDQSPSIQIIHNQNDLYFVVVSLNGNRDTVEILAKLQENVSSQKQNMFSFLRETESLVAEAKTVIEGGGLDALGRLMSSAQMHFDRFVVAIHPEQLSAPNLHAALNYDCIQEHILGGKWTGAGGDGSLLLLAKSKSAQQKVIQIMKRDLGLDCLTLCIPSSGIKEESLSRNDRLPKVKPDFNSLSLQYTPKQDWARAQFRNWTELVVPHFADRKQGVDVLELGCWEGLSACWWLCNLVYPHGHLVCVDHFDGQHTEAGRERYNKLKANIAATCMTDSTTIVQAFTVTALSTLVQERREWDLVYVDASHRSDDTLLDAMLAWKGLRNGGLMIFDDYLWPEYPVEHEEHPKRGIDAFLSVHAEQLENVSTDYQLIVKKKTEVRFNI